MFHFILANLSNAVVETYSNFVQFRKLKKIFFLVVQGCAFKSSLAAEIAKARQHIKNSLECVSSFNIKTLTETSAGHFLNDG
jgi:hypothetical protein